MNCRIRTHFSEIIASNISPWVWHYHIWDDLGTMESLCHQARRFLTQMNLQLNIHCVRSLKFSPFSYLAPFHTHPWQSSANVRSILSLLPNLTELCECKMKTAAGGNYPETQNC